jgi:transposase-like protein
MSSQKNPNHYTSEFKESAVKLATENNLAVSKTA